MKYKEDNLNNGRVLMVRLTGSCMALLRIFDCKLVMSEDLPTLIFGPVAFMPRLDSNRISSSLTSGFISFLMTSKIQLSF